MQKAKPYAETKERLRKFAADASQSGRDIGEIPEVKDPKRRKYSLEHLRNYCEVYHSETFCWPWSRDHLTVLDKLDKVIRVGGLLAIAMPRGSGKTSMCETGGEFSVTSGLRHFPVLIGATDTHATDMLGSIKLEFEVNEDLHDDFPEICHAIWALEGIANRAQGQLYQGERTRIKWATDFVRFPYIPGSTASSAIMRVAGLTGRIRGMKEKTPEGKTIRPDLVIIDDPQTDESARSVSQNKTRMNVIQKAVLKLAGKRKKIAVAMPCTVIEKDDMADEMLDRKKHPEWQGVKMKLVYSFPDNEQLWDDYADILIEDMRNEAGRERANKFYTDNREAMDKGAEVAWEHAILEDEVSAIQNAMNQFIIDPDTFWAESQNEPKEEHDTEGLLSKQEISEKVNRYDRLVVPPDCTRITAFIDVQKEALYYLVAGWAEGFTGYIIDYGTFPDQHKMHFRLTDIKRTLKKEYPNQGMEGRIFQGLKELTKIIYEREYTRHDGVSMYMNQLMIDANWGQSTETVYSFIRQSGYINRNIMPSHGMGITASRLPISRKKAVKGEEIGAEWRIPIPTKRKERHIVYDTNHWKTFVHARLAVAIGDTGALSLFGNKPRQHSMLAEQLTAEYRVATEGQGRKVWEWKMPVSKPDNHFFDCLVGAAVAASVQGIALPGMESKQKKRKRVSFSDMQKQRKRGV